MGDVVKLNAKVQPGRAFRVLSASDPFNHPEYWLDWEFVQLRRRCRVPEPGPTLQEARLRLLQDLASQPEVIADPLVAEAALIAGGFVSLGEAVAALNLRNVTKPVNVVVVMEPEPEPA